MTTTEWITDTVLVLVVFRQLRESRLDRKTFLIPLGIVAFVAYSYLDSVPTAGNDLVLIAALTAVGAALGVAGGVHTRIRALDGHLVIKAGAVSALLWVLGMGARMGFQVWVRRRSTGGRRRRTGRRGADGPAHARDGRHRGHAPPDRGASGGGGGRPDPFADDESILGALGAGARGYLTKNAGRQDITRAIRAAGAGQSVLDREVQNRLLATARAKAPAPGPAGRPLPDDLTPREREVLALIGQGLSNRGIAEKLFISEATVKTHINNLFAKSHIRDRAEAVRRAIGAGLA